MLFDLRGSGRRTTVKAVYLTLALLMGGGLVLFGIGGDVSGGLVDALTENNGGTTTNDSTFRRRADEATRAAQADPQNAAVWAEVARTRYQYAGAGDFLDRNTGEFTAEGKAQLQQAATAWEKHLELAKNKPDDRVATLMVQAYSHGGPQRAGEGRRGAGDHHRGTPEGLDLRDPRRPRLPGRPDPQGRPRHQGSPRARRRGRPRDAEVRARPGEAAEPRLPDPGRNRVADGDRDP